MKFSKTKANLILLIILLILSMSGMFWMPRSGVGATTSDVFSHLIFVPLILAGLWFGLTGGLGYALLLSISSIVSSSYITAGSSKNWLELLIEVSTFFLIGSVTGYLSGRRRAERLRLAEALSDRDKAYADLGAKTTDLFTAEEELRRGERLRVLGELSSELAHEIQNPLASIKGTAEILNDRCQRNCGTGEFIDIMMSEIKRLRKVLDRFLDYARNQDTDTPVCNAISAFDDVIRLMKHQMEKQRIQLSLQSPPDGCFVRISDEQLKQVFVNLVLNAIQAMSEGGEIRAVFDERGMEACITISDTGPGIKEKNRDRVFTPFFSTKREGTGLGLPIVWRIMTKHNGTIALAEKPEGGTGACFVMTLPLCSSVEKEALRSRSIPA